MAKKWFRVSTVGPKGQKSVRGIGPSYRTGGPELAARRAAYRASEPIVAPEMVAVRLVDVARNSPRGKSWTMIAYPELKGFSPAVREYTGSEKDLVEWMALRGWGIGAQKTVDKCKKLRFVPVEGATKLTVPAVKA